MYVYKCVSGVVSYDEPNPVTDVKWGCSWKHDDSMYDEKEFFGMFHRKSCSREYRSIKRDTSTWVVPTYSLLVYPTSDEPDDDTCGGMVHFTSYVEFPSVDIHVCLPSL